VKGKAMATRNRSTVSSKKAKPEKAAESINAASPREGAVDALMGLLQENRWQDVSLPMIADKAGISLADLRDAYPSKGAILGGLARRIDRIVLSGVGDDMLGEPIRDRVLDVMLKRLDALAPYKQGLNEVMRAARMDPLMLAVLNQLALNSWRYMLAAADVDVEDELGLLRVQGAALVFARTLDTWFEDDDPDMAATMARLDKELKSGERVMRGAENLRRIAAPFRGMMRAAFERRQPSRPKAEA
jgi:AcrR family transcriptional regulator